MAKPSRRPGSAVIRAVPFTRSVSPAPGTKKSRATAGLAMMSRSASSRLLPRRSGRASVRSSSGRMKPGRIAARGRMDALRPDRRQDGEGAGGDEGQRLRLELGDHLLQHQLARRIIDRRPAARGWRRRRGRRGSWRPWAASVPAGWSRSQACRCLACRGRPGKPLCGTPWRWLAHAAISRPSIGISDREKAGAMAGHSHAKNIMHRKAAQGAKKARPSAS